MCAIHTHSHIHIHIHIQMMYKHIYSHICELCTHTSTHIHTHDVQTCTHMCTHIHAFTYTHSHPSNTYTSWTYMRVIYTHMHTSIHIHTHMCTHTHIVLHILELGCWCSAALQSSHSSSSPPLCCCSDGKDHKLTEHLFMHICPSCNHRI